MKLFAIVFLFAFGSTVYAQQTGTTIAPVTVPESLVGKFSGNYIHPKYGARGAELVIKGGVGNNVQASFSAFRRNSCGGGNIPAEGTLEQKILNIRVEAPNIAGCTSDQLRLSVSDDGKKLDGEMTNDGLTMPIHLSR